MYISYVVAMGPNREIGLNNKLLWHIPEDLKNFKKITTGRMIVMGRKTFESIGRPLPDRANVVVTNNPSFNPPGVIIANDPMMVLDLALEAEADLEDEGFEVMVIGGAQIYQEFMPYVSKIYLSEVNYSGECDTYFPEFDKSEWTTVSEEKFQDFTFKVLEKN